MYSKMQSGKFLDKIRPNAHKMRCGDKKVKQKWSIELMSEPENEREREKQRENYC